MNAFHQIARCILSTLLLLALAEKACAEHDPYVPTLQPYQTASPHGVYLFEVNPSQRNGAGPCMAVLTNTKTKECIWKRELPFTFWQACVNDDGVVGGFGYSKGPMGDGPLGSGSEGGDFIVRMLNAKGVITYEETSPRGSTISDFTPSSPILSAQQLLLESKYNRMIIRIGDRFRFYSLGEFRLVSAVVPMLGNSIEIPFYWEDARVLPGCHFLLVQLHRNLYDTNSEDTLFLMMDENGKIHWSVKYSNEIWKDGDIRNSTSQLPGEILSVQSDRTQNTNPSVEHTIHFDLYFGATKERITYKVVDTSTETELSGKAVEEKRIKWAPSVADEDAPPKNFPKLASKTKGEFILLDPDQKPLTFCAFAVGPHDQIYALDYKTGCVHVFDSNGKPLHICQPGKEHHVAGSLTVDDQGEVFVELNSNSPSENGDPFASGGGYFLHFSPDGYPAEKLLPPLEKDSDVIRLARPKSNQLVISRRTTVSLVSQEVDVRTVDATLTHRADGQWFEWINDVCLAPDGSIAVFSGPKSDSGVYGFSPTFPIPPNHLPKHTISLYRPDGTPIRAVDFTAGDQLSQIAFDGKYIITTGNYFSPNAFIYIFKATGEAVGTIQIDGFGGRQNKNLEPFIIEKGKAILILDSESGRGFRYAMPK